MLEEAIAKIRDDIPGLELRENEPMSAHCSFRIGGPVRAMLLPASAGELIRACTLLRDMGIEPLIMGNGTNLLVTDRPLSRIAVKTCDGMGKLECTGNTVTAGSGVTLAKLAVFAQKNGLTGLEFAHGIPGSLGGAVSMNAGAYGGEMKDVISSSVYLDKDCALQTAEGGEHDFSYRHSAFLDSGAVLIESKLSLTPGDPDEIGEKMRILSEKRRASQPLDRPSAGSTFKRPASGYAAALIERAGLKGFSIGGAQVSEKHSGFVINRGGAGFDDVLALMDHIRETVYKAFGIMLEPEVRIIDD